MGNAQREWFLSRRLLLQVNPFAETTLKSSPSLLTHPPFYILPVDGIVFLIFFNWTGFGIDLKLYYLWYVHLPVFFHTFILFQAVNIHHGNNMKTMYPGPCVLQKMKYTLNVLVVLILINLKSFNSYLISTRRYSYILADNKWAISWDYGTFRPP